jgi:signal peptide peptidase SppA
MNWKRPFSRKKSPVVAVLRLDGAIGPSASRFRGSMLNIQSQASRIEIAFKQKRLTALAIVVNSPGGSPVQSALIAGRIRALAEEKDVPVFAFAEDVAASGGYWLACAGDEIFVNEASIIGSIGVVSSGFGFQEFIERHGIERRVHAAGESKAILDPFLPEKLEDVARLKGLQEDVHGHFKNYVTSRRGLRLNQSSEELFSGAFWVGTRAVELGLADGVGDIRSVLRQKYGDNVRMVPIGESKSIISSVLGRTSIGSHGSNMLGALPEQTMAAIEERAIWARFGL